MALCACCCCNDSLQLKVPRELQQGRLQGRRCHQSLRRQWQELPGPHNRTARIPLMNFAPGLAGCLKSSLAFRVSADHAVPCRENLFGKGVRSTPLRGTDAVALDCTLHHQGGPCEPALHLPWRRHQQGGRFDVQAKGHLLRRQGWFASRLPCRLQVPNCKNTKQKLTLGSLCTPVPPLHRPRTTAK